MSSNRLIYDTCAYKHELTQSVGPLEYVLNPMKYENCNKCRMELGLVGGTAVSHVKGNLVDLIEDELLLALPFISYHKKEECESLDTKILLSKSSNKTEEINTESNPFEALRILKDKIVEK